MKVRVSTGSRIICHLVRARRILIAYLTPACTVLLFSAVGANAILAADKAKSNVTKQFEEVLKQVYRARTARTALMQLDAFEAAYALPEDIQSRLQVQRQKFAELNEKGLIRLGNNWVTESEFSDAAKNCAAEIEIAKECLKNSDGKGMIQHLEKAAKLNPNAVEPNFFLGMLFSIKGNCNPPLAEKYFEKVAAINPDYVPVLNNLALTEVKLGKFDEAYAHWKQLARINPRSPELLQNLGRIEREGAADRLLISRRKAASSKGKTRYELFAELAAESREIAGVTDANHGLGTGWLYSPLVKAWGEEIAPPGDFPEPDRDVQLASDRSKAVRGEVLIPVGSGTGFAISPTVVMTNRHVVENEVLGTANAVTLQSFSGKVSERLSGNILAISDTADLALIEVPGLNANPIPFSARPIQRGVEAGIFGFPRGMKLGATLKLTRGLVTALPGGKYGDSMFMLDAEANPGNSGGPVSDPFGQVMGVLTAITFEHEGDYSLAIPGKLAQDFAGLHMPELQTGPLNTPEKPWKDIDAGVCDSVFYIEVLYRGSSLKLAECLPPKVERPKSELEDISCGLCNGRGMRKCTYNGCAAGGIIESTWEASTVDLGSNFKATKLSSSVSKRRCPNCDGRGFVTCDPCRGEGLGADIR